MLRLNQLARELGVSNQEIIDLTRSKLGMGGKSHSSNLTDDQADQLRASFLVRPEVSISPSGSNQVWPPSGRNQQRRGSSASPKIQYFVDISGYYKYLMISAPADIISKIARDLRLRFTATFGHSSRTASDKNFYTYWVRLSDKPLSEPDDFRFIEDVISKYNTHHKENQSSPIKELTSIISTIDERQEKFNFLIQANKTLEKTKEDYDKFLDQLIKESDESKLKLVEAEGELMELKFTHELLKSEYNDLIIENHELEVKYNHILESRNYELGITDIFLRCFPHVQLHRGSKEIIEVETDDKNKLLNLLISIANNNCIPKRKTHVAGWLEQEFNIIHHDDGRVYWISNENKLHILVGHKTKSSQKSDFTYMENLKYSV